MGTTLLTSQLADINLGVRNTLSYAEKHLQHLQRSSGESYVQHGKEVADALMEVTEDPDLLSAAILHDILVHPDGEKLLSTSPLSAEQQMLVRDMHQLRHLHIDMYTDDLDRVIGAFADDGRLLLLRMAHRLNDVRHFDRFDAERRKEIAHETLHMYTAISGRLGFHRWRWQMEDCSFEVLQPAIAKRMRERYEESSALDHTCLQHAHTFLQEQFAANGLTADIDQRMKGLYSTYRKMVLKNRRFEDLTDRLALRILVPTVEDCYRALGVVHNCMHPMHGKLKDYIGTPKENSYRSIHTVVYPLQGISELPIEIQIRTHEMHRACEYGIASHGTYKNLRYSLFSPATRANLFRNLENLHAVLKSQRTFKEALKHSFRTDRLLVFDPQNNLYHLPHSATARDAAMHINPGLAPSIATIRINGRERPLDTQLRDGDTVEIL